MIRHYGIPKVFDFIISVGTELSFLPSLKLIYSRRRHFECFIGVFHLLSSVMFSSCKTLMRPIVLQSIQWHLLSDVMTETYLCLLCIHLLGLKNEDKMMALRYFAFASLFIAKLADGWDNMRMQTLILVAYSCMPVLHIIDSLAKHRLPIKLKRLPYNKVAIKPAAGCIVAGVTIFIFCGRYDSKKGPNHLCEMLLSLAHLLFGIGSFFLWKILPCFDKSEELAMFK